MEHGPQRVIHVVGDVARRGYVDAEERARRVIRRYEAASSQPTLDVLRNVALALATSADSLLFDEDERGPDDDLRLQFEATRALDDDEKEALKALLEGFLLRHDARRWTSAS